MAGELDGRVVLVTGATNGIGLVAARELAGMGATTCLVARDRARGEDAIRQIREATGNDRLSLFVGDLSSQAEVRRVAAEVRAATGRLHVLLNNAGAIFTRRQVSADGIEMTFALNHLGYFLLTRELEPLLVAGAPSRVVNVSSSAHRRARMDWEDLFGERAYSSWKAYGQSKLANILHARELSRRMSDRGVAANALHPGAVATGWGRNNAGLFRLVMQVGAPFLLRPVRGARTSVYLASSPDVEGVTGQYFEDRRPVRPSHAATSDADARRLWDLSERLVADRR
ncbi:MAG TPA: SDR family oxidoreductase [Anaeromyxobacteraceae bacterium]|nr:SDR family oxidoreductase [Anaeromyxobacteraceae bacterium]